MEGYGSDCGVWLSAFHVGSGPTVLSWFYNNHVSSEDSEEMDHDTAQPTPYSLVS